MSTWSHAFAFFSICLFNIISNIIIIIIINNNNKITRV